MENTLNIQIKVTDEQLTSLLRGKIESLPDEKIQEIFTSALTEFFRTDNGQRLFYTKDYYSSNPSPTRLLIDMVENAASKELLKPCVDEFINTLKDQYADLITKAMVQTFSNMFFTEMQAADLQYQLNQKLNISDFNR